MSTALERTKRALAAMMHREGIGSSLRAHDPVAEPQGIVRDPSDLIGLHASTDILVKDMADILMKHWPGFRWAIQPSEFGKIFNVFCLDFHPVWGYRIKYTDIMNDPKRRAVVRAGRTLLRRFGYASDRYDPQAMAALPRDAKGQAIPIVDGLPETRHTVAAKVQRAAAQGQVRVVGQRAGGGVIVEVKS